MASDARRAAAYVSWATFKEALARLTRSLPSRVDDTVFPDFPAGARMQLFPALKFLGLISDERAPTEELRRLAALQNGARRSALRRLFERQYAELLLLDLGRATLAQVEEAMGRAYLISGSTLRKAVRFFVLGATELGIPISDYLRGTSDDGGGLRSGIRHRRAPTPRAISLPQPVFPGLGGPFRLEARVVSLASGGTLTVSAAVNFVGLSPRDRALVNAVLERLDEYERESQPGTAELEAPA